MSFRLNVLFLIAAIAFSVSATQWCALCIGHSLSPAAACETACTALLLDHSEHEHESESHGALGHAHAARETLATVAHAQDATPALADSPALNCPVFSLAIQPSIMPSNPPHSAALQALRTIVLRC